MDPSISLGSSAWNQRCTLFIETDAAALKEHAIRAPQDPHEGKDRKRESRPVDKGAASLLCEDGEKGPGDRDGRGEVTLRGGEGVGRGCALKEESAMEASYRCRE